MREPAAVPIAQLIDELAKTVNGFKDIEKAAQRDWKALSPQTAVDFAKELYRLDVRQARMYSVFLLGYSASDDALQFMKDVVSNDGDWRVQEILAKAFDEFCKTRGYENSLPVIDMWLSDENPNVRRAVSEGLRIWTGRPFFKEHPQEAVKRLAFHKEDPSEYVRKSVGNALRDISKKHPDLIRDELRTWRLETKEIKQTYRLANAFLTERKRGEETR